MVAIWKISFSGQAAGPGHPRSSSLAKFCRGTTGTDGLTSGIPLSPPGTNSRSPWAIGSTLHIAFGNGIKQIKTELEYDTNGILNKIRTYNDQRLTIEYDVVINENGNLIEISNNSGTTPIYYDDKLSPYKNFSVASKFLTMAGIKSIFSINNEISSNIEINYNSDDYPSKKKWSYPQPNSTIFITTIDYEYELFDD